MAPLLFSREDEHMPLTRKAGDESPLCSSML